MARTIEVIVGTSGDIRIESTGFKGPDCEKATAFLEQAEAKKVYEKQGIPVATLKDRIAHVVQSAFNGRRIVIFSGGAAEGTDAVLAEVREIAAGGAFGSIMGRNAFQRPKAEAIELLHAVMDIYAKA